MGVLLVGHGITAKLGKESLDGEDEAVERDAVSDVVDLGGDGFIGENLGGSASKLGLVILAGSLIVNLSNQRRPRGLNGRCVAEVGNVVDEQADVIVASLVGEFVEQLHPC